MKNIDHNKINVSEETDINKSKKKKKKNESNA